MKQSSLRQLSHEYARGLIDRTQYHQRRAELIDSILAAMTQAGDDTEPGTDPTQRSETTGAVRGSD